uniref:BHLH domain-containing protein n=1 Tax=Aegilops tauschii subsp. strangulata TaxID=200361 RepID=A0A453M9Y8_AEGTS
MAMPPPPPPPLYPATAGGKPERKTVERNRRNQMNALYYRLDTLVRAGGAAPSPAVLMILYVQPAAATRPDRLGEAAAYISRTAERVERLKDRKRELTAARAASTTELGTGSGSSSGAATVMVEVQHLGSGLHGILVTGAPPSDGSMFHRAVRAVEEAGGEVQNAHFSVVGARAVYTIHTLENSKAASRGWCKGSRKQYVDA